LALWPYAALHWPIRKIAAIAGLITGAIYLAMSGANIATQRAFIMVAVMFVALLFDRRALSLRSVAMAALILLVWRPEAVLGAGFQMSFAATTALIVAFGRLRHTKFGHLPKWIKPVAAVLASSLIAGIATAPFAAAHFNIIASYGLLANLLAVPVMGLVVMPGALLAAGFIPLGFETAGLWIMGLGIDWILWVAQFVSNLEGGVRFVPMPGPWVLPLMVFGGICILLRPGPRLRKFGGVPLVLGALIWSVTPRPDILISQSGALIGVRGPSGLVLSKEKGESFAATNWLQNDGDMSTQTEAFARTGFAHRRARSDWPSLNPDLQIEQIVQLRGKNASILARDVCLLGVVLVSLKPLNEPQGPCAIFDPARLRDTGSVAVQFTKNDMVWSYANAISGARLWTDPRLRR